MRHLKINQSFTIKDDQSLEKYLQEIAKEDLLSAEEEVELAQLIKKGDQKALEKLIRGNLRFVVSVAKQYQHQGLSLSDLINEGNLGLMKAAQKFDDTFGFKFISYAVWWIRQSIQQAISEQSRIVRLPLNQVGSVHKINKIRNKFEQENERKPSVDEIAAQTDLSESQIIDVISNEGKHISVDAPLAAGSNNSLLDVLPDNDGYSIDKKMEIESLREEIKWALTILSERESQIIMAYFGIGQDEMTMEEIGQKMGLSRERVRQIKDKAIKKLRNSTKNKLLKNYLSDLK